MSLLCDIAKDLGGFRLRMKFETDGGVLGLLGASGCGKSLTLRCIVGIERPDRGRIVLNGRVLFDSEKHIDLKPQERRVGCLFQNYALFPNMTVRGNLLCGLRGEKDRAVRARVLDDTVRMLHLEELLERRPAQLSGGQQQRAALARILVNRPELLMLDEPFSALDAHLRTLIQPELLDLLTQYGRDALLVTHNRDEAYFMCGQLAVMGRGRIDVLGDRRAVFADPVTTGAALITGCKNVTAARADGEETLRADGWGAAFTLGRPLPAGTTAVGIRAHALKPAEGPGENVIAVRDPEIREEPFTVSVIFRTEGPDRIRWNIGRAAWEAYGRAALPTRLYVSPADVMPLRDA